MGGKCYPILILRPDLESFHQGASFWPFFFCPETMGGKCYPILILRFEKIWNPFIKAHLLAAQMKGAKTLFLLPHIVISKLWFPRAGWE